MVKRILLVCVFLLITACSESEPTVVKKETDPKNPNQEPELVEETKEDKTEEYIEFTLPDEQVMVHLEMVPILYEYIHATKNRQQAIEEMNMHRINVEETDLYLLEFSCHDELCSYLLLDQSKDNQAYLIADLAKLIQTKISSDSAKVLFQFNRTDTSLPLPLTDLVVVNLNQWEPVALINETNETVTLDYTWPIITVEWINDTTINALKPDIEEPTSELITQWQDNGKPNTTISFTINQK
ncbi:hypothetical protein ACFQ3N_11680 [Virgibacillus byunsanensis]|uniref:Lipoprotein n=1 Tax=Virgibacillus byunsanensis TaxID=570945 RepID=A0ABW3LML1_9BACI